MAEPRLPLVCFIHTIFQPQWIYITPRMHHVFAQLSTFTPVASSLLFVRCLIFVLQTNPYPAFKIPNLELIIKLMLKYLFNISAQFSSVQTLCDPMNRSMPGLPVPHQLLEFTQTHVHRVGDATQPSHPLSSPSLPATNPSQHQSLFQWVNSSHEVAKVLEFQL